MERGTVLAFCGPMLSEPAPDATGADNVPLPGAPGTFAVYPAPGITTPTARIDRSSAPEVVQLTTLWPDRHATRLCYLATASNSHP